MRAQGSYTVEAALIVPVVLGCILLILSQAINLYVEVSEDTVSSGWWQEFEPADSFRRMELLRKVSEEKGEE